MGLQWGISKKHTRFSKKAENNRIATKQVVVSSVDINELGSNARV